jgi:hypothetical protein
MIGTATGSNIATITATATETSTATGIATATMTATETTTATEVTSTIGATISATTTNDVLVIYTIGGISNVTVFTTAATEIGTASATITRQSTKITFASTDIDNLLRDGYIVFSGNSTVYLNGVHVGYIAVETAAAAQKAGLPSSAVVGIASSLSVLGLLAAVIAAAFLMRRRRRREKKDSLPQKAPETATAATQEATIYTNPAIEPRSAQQQQRQSMTLYHAKAKPHKKMMMPILSQTMQANRPLSHLRLNF